MKNYEYCYKPYYDKEDWVWADSELLVNIEMATGKIQFPHSRDRLLELMHRAWVEGFETGEFYNRNKMREALGID